MNCDLIQGLFLRRYVKNVKKSSLVLYFLITFLLSWICWSTKIFKSLYFIKYIYGYGVVFPILVALVLTILLGGKGELKGLLKRFNPKGLNKKWYVLSIFSIMIISILSVMISFTVEGRHFSIIEVFSFENYIKSFPIFIIFATMEEVGWRGYALPKLEKSYSQIASSVILGVIWGMWHLPKLIAEGTKDLKSITIFMLTVVLFSIYISWIYSNTNGNILMAILSHAAINSAINSSYNGELGKIGYNTSSIIFLGLILIFLIILLNKGELTNRHENRLLERK
ncbi:CAAX amino terminal protease self- immunity [Clostridium vincentii]|uniref:CAAX amino terminal protease self-immunity n=1 Tax=Clostridium vincentii TaxID=52704 RepID=A0A2T0BF40_9CLOT|nr:CAAX amino terminal protease self- immunity [Clostridium vincentii]